jgi:hypothetical protein
MITHPIEHEEFLFCIFFPLKKNNSLITNKSNHEAFNGSLPSAGHEEPFSALGILLVFDDSEVDQAPFTHK